MTKFVHPEVAASAARAIKVLGGAELARRIGVTRFAVHQWKAAGIPAKHVGRVSAVTDIPIHDLRPDLFEPPVGAASPPPAAPEAA